MIGVEDTVRLVEERFPEKYVGFVGKYKGRYLVCAPRRDGSDLFEIPGVSFYVVNRLTGAMKQILPVDDLKGFAKARKHTLYERGEWI